MSTQMKVTREKVVEGPSSSVKTTTYETRSSHEYEYDAPRYKSMMTPRSTVIQRTAYAGPGGGSSMSMTRSMSAGLGVMPMAAGTYHTVTSTGVQNVRQSREREKKDMQDLNERFASYIEKVRFLEAQNRKLADELEKLKTKWGKETSAIKAMYQAELDEARRLLDDNEKDKAKLEIKVSSLEEMVDELRHKLDEAHARIREMTEQIDTYGTKIGEYEAEIAMHRRRGDALEAEHARDRAEIARLTDALNRARADLDSETLNHIDAENRRQTLEEELEFMKQVHEQEMKELAALAYRDTTAENREFWKNEMGQAMREIQGVYDEKLEALRGELETYYNLKIQEFRTGATRQNMETIHAKEESKKLRGMLTDLRQKLNDAESRVAMLEKELDNLKREYTEKEHEWEAENTELKNEVAKLRAEMEAILKELQDLMDTKLGLELEIAAYRKLLEGEENRIGLRNVVDSWITGRSETTEDSSLRVSQVVKGEMSAKTTYQRSAKGPIAITDCAADGTFVTLENTGSSEHNQQLRIVRTVDGQRPRTVRLPISKFPPNKKIKVFAKGRKGAGGGGPDDIEADIGEWGIGANITTKLQTDSGEDKATHIQKTIYT